MYTPSHGASFRPSSDSYSNTAFHRNNRNTHSTQTNAPPLRNIPPPSTGSWTPKSLPTTTPFSNHAHFRSQCLANQASLTREEVVNALTTLSQYLQSQELCLDNCSKEDKDFYRMLQGKIAGFAGHYTPKELTNIACALAKLEVHSPALFEFIATQSQGKIMKFGTGELSKLAWAFAKTGNKHTEVFKSIRITSELKMAYFKPHELSKLAWASAIIDREGKEVFSNVFMDKLINQIPLHATSYNDTDCMQIKQFYLYLRDIKGIEPGWEDTFKNKVDEAAKTESKRGRPSALQNRIEKVIKTAFPQATLTSEFIHPKTAYSVDIHMMLDGREYAFEVDGPAHFVQLGENRDYNQTSKFKTVILSKHITLIRIDFQEWRKKVIKEDQIKFIFDQMVLAGYKPIATAISANDVAERVFDSIAREKEVDSRGSSPGLSDDIDYTSSGGSSSDSGEGSRSPSRSPAPLAVGPEEKPEVNVEKNVTSLQSKVIMGLWLALTVGTAAATYWYNTQRRL